jgi:hypothetical protein
MFREACWLQPAAEVLQPGEVVGVKTTLSADRQANPVNGNRKPFSQMSQLRERATAFTHVVLGVDLVS